VAALEGLIPLTVSGVYPGRVHPFKTEDLPALSVFTANEVPVRERDVMDGGPADPEQWRALELLVEVRVKVASTASPDLLSALDVVALEVERAIEEDATLAGLLKELDLASTVQESEGENSEAPVGVLMMTWAAVYRCNPADPATIT